MLTVQLSITAPETLNYVLIEDFFPAGTEAVNPDLLTEANTYGRPVAQRTDLAYGWGWWYFSHIELQDEKLELSARRLPAGSYLLTYQIRLTNEGSFHVIPTRAWEFYFPDVYGRSEGLLFTVVGRKD